MAAAAAAAAAAGEGERAGREAGGFVRLTRHMFVSQSRSQETITAIIRGRERET